MLLHELLSVVAVRHGESDVKKLRPLRQANVSFPDQQNQTLQWPMQGGGVRLGGLAAMTVTELETLIREAGVTVSITGHIREVDVAKVLAVSQRTIRRWRLSGMLRADRIGRSWRYSIDVLVSTFDQRRAADPLHESLPHRQHRHRHAVPCSRRR